MDWLMNSAPEHRHTSGSSHELPLEPRAKVVTSRHNIFCEREDVVVGDEAPLSGVAQVVSHGVKVVGVHGEEGKEKDEEVRVEVKGEVEENRGQPHMDGMWIKVKDSRTT